ncbi:MAG: amidohydrolase family protein [Smithella sp.]|nr:amidohydrolase family protein [Smithella sp.]
MHPKQIIDIHCHLFNAKYAIMELASASWNHLRGNYPHQKGVTLLKMQKRGIIKTLEGVKDFAAYIARLLKAVLSDCEGNYKTSLGNFANSTLNKNASLIVAPLMMDIYFALDDNTDEANLDRKGRLAAPKIEAFAVPEDNQKDFEEHFKNIESIIREEFKKIQPDTKRLLLSGDKLAVIFDDVKKELLAAPRKLLKSVDPYAGIELSPGYKKHMLELEELAIKYPGKVFPFLAIDPRRIGIMKLIEMKVNKGKGIFKGIKIYPPLGYLPTHPNLVPVFDYCVQYDIPITLHCSPGGMNNFRKKNYIRSWDEKNHLEDFKTTENNKSIYYTAPEKWLPVLKKWPNLRINFAHFGGGDQLIAGKTDWMDKITQFIKEHPRVYTDISYHTDKKSPCKILEVVGKNDCLNTKLMFGTDYIMIMMDKTLGGLKNYFDHYTVLNNRLLYENAKDFMKLK